MMCASEKDLLSCFKYIMKRIEKALNKTNGYLPDQVVYDFSLEYYLNAEEEFLIEDKQTISCKYENEPIQKKYISDNSEQKSLF